MKVYLLQHWYSYGEDNEHDEVKLIGIFSSREKAEDAVKRYINLPGFCDFSEECFYIGEHVLDETEWKEGFIEC
jgi:hypothetical protein